MKYKARPILLFLTLLVCHSTIIGQPNLLKKKKGEEPSWPISYSLKGTPYFGVAPVVETATGTVRSFAIGELLREYPLQLNGQSLPVALVNHYFEAPYSVAGYIENGKARLKIYVNGKRIAEEYCRDDMFEILMVISRAIGAQTDLPKKSMSININEGNREKLPEKSINQLLPGQLFCRVPEDTIINIFKQLQSVETYKVDDLYKEAKFVKGRFGPIDESDINFFKWREIPYSLKDVARKLVFPISATMGPALSYISIGHQLHVRGDAHAAYHCYLGAIGGSKDLLASPYESGALRYVAFRELAKIYEGPNEGRKKTAELLRMVSAAHLAYLNDPGAKKERVQYYNSIVEIGVKLQEAESEAQTQRTTRTFSMINNGLTAATSITAAATGNQQAATAYMSETQKGLTKQMEQDRAAKDQLLKKYHEYDKKVIATTFRMDDGMNFDQGKPLTPGEIAYLLIKSPETTQRILNAFASDKPKLKILANKYYQSKTDTNLESLFQYFNDYESKVVNYECRGLAIPQKVSAEF
jgi:hypothetical protein